MQATTTLFRIEIVYKTGIETTTGLIETARQLGIHSITDCRLVRLFFLKGQFTEAEAHRLASELLADPVTEDYSLFSEQDSQLPADAHSIDVTLLPGVTDPAAENLLRAAHLLAIIGVEQVATGQRYLLWGDLSEAELKRLASEVCANAVIQRYSIDEPISAPFFAYQQSDDTVEIINIQRLDDDALIAVSQERRLSLNIREMRAIRDYFEEIERDPSDVELEMLAQTWSEHCVHKTFKARIDYTGPDGEETIDGILNTYLRAATDKINKPWVHSAFVDNAGIIAFDDQYDIAFKVETHNRPSAIEPFGGANTGVGGVIRDVIGVSARPIANTDILFFGPPDLPDSELQPGVLHPRRIADGVVSGIEDYGNKMGIPTVNGAIHYHKGYTSNPLVFCGCLGILPRGSHRTQAESGDFIVVIGGRTGRDGIRGATFSSMEINQDTSTVSGGAVQIGHPIHEKQAMEAILLARDEGLYTAITDCGAGGLSSAIGEMGEKIGAHIQLQDIPLKYPGLRPWEIWLSEAQERMVLAVPPENWERVKAICDGQDIEAVAIGTFKPTGHLELYYGDQLVGDLSMHFLHDGLPRWHLQAEWAAPIAPSEPVVSKDSPDVTDTLLKLLAHPNIRSKEDVIRRYDHEVQGGTAIKPLTGLHNQGPSDATVIVPNVTLKTLTLNPSPIKGEGLQNGAVKAEAESPLTPNPSPTGGERGGRDSLYVPPELEQKMREVARRLRREATTSEKILWEALRNRQLKGRKFRRQQPVGAFVLDFYCAEERLAVEVDGEIHQNQQEDDQLRQQILESLGIRFVRVTSQDVEQNISDTLSRILAAFTPSPLVGEGAGGEGTKAVALSNGFCPQYGALDPYAMAWAAIDESIRNLVAVGTDPDQIAILDNFCWGNTSLPDRLGAMVRAAQGCHDAAMAYGTPFVSGKDSLNNEYMGADGERHPIPGTLVISAVGIVPDVTKTVTMDLKAPGHMLYIIGETRDEMGGSHYNLLHGIEGGTVPQPNADALNTYRALHKAIQAGLVEACHDVSEGGLAVALAEMCIAGGLGAKLVLSLFSGEKDAFFSESTGRFLVGVTPENRHLFQALFDDTSCKLVGMVLEDKVLRLLEHTDENLAGIPITELEQAWRGVTETPTITALPSQPAITSSFNRAPATHTQAPKVLILHATGTNRDHDAALACELAGGQPEIVHVNQLLSGERILSDYHMLVVPGGFSYGDDLGAGAVWALDLRHRLHWDVSEFIQQGRPVIGICNGFQALVKAGLLPGEPLTPNASPTKGEGRLVTLSRNEKAQFECRWVYLQPNPNSPSLFTQGLDEPIYCPIAHGEGRVIARDAAAQDMLWENGLAALTYVDANSQAAGYPVNPNGSDLNIAALSNREGNVFGLMPHPENHIFPWQHPRYHRGERGLTGLRLFQNGIKYA